MIAKRKWSILVVSALFFACISCNSQTERSREYTVKEIIEIELNSMHQDGLDGGRDSIVIYGREDSEDRFTYKESGGCFDADGEWMTIENGVTRRYPIKESEVGMGYSVYTDGVDDRIIFVYPSNAFDPAPSIDSDEGDQTEE